MDLSGIWRCASLSPELNLSGADPDLDDNDWAQISVPGHWGSIDAFDQDHGPVLYRRRFTAEPLALNKRAWLRIDGVVSEAEIWLDGNHIGDTDLYFSPRRFDITDHLGADKNDPPTEHLLAIQVSGGDVDSHSSKRSIVGSLQTGTLAPPGPSGGIWRPVGVDTTGPVAITRSRAICTKATPEEAELLFRVSLDAANASDVTVNTSVVGPDGSTAGGSNTHSLARGENHIEWTTTISDPMRWWPASLGEQPLYDVSITINDTEGILNDRRQWRTGLRTVTMHNFQWTINGEKMFLKGVAMGPQSRFPGLVEVDRFHKDVRTVRDAGLDLIRVYGHVSRPELYDAADELGVLVWQDLPLVGSYSTRTRARARAAARSAADELAHHPSIVVWCGHEEPNGPPIPSPEPDQPPLTGAGRRLGKHLLPSWNRSVLAPLVRRELKTADPSRPVVTRSGSIPNPTDLVGSDSHLWLGWRTGHTSDLAEVIRRWPRLGTFVGAFGSQSVGVQPWGDDEPSWPSAERGSFERYVPRRVYPDGETWASATRAYQADLIRSHIECLRRLKYKPTGGFCVMALSDAEEAGGFGLLDWHRHAKPAFDVLVDACRPVVVIADTPPLVATPGQELSLAVHVVSDLRSKIDEATMTARVTAGDWETKRQWIGPVDGDSCTFIADLTFSVPEVTGPLVIDLELDSEFHAATNRYRTVIIPSAEATSSSYSKS